MSYQEPKFKPGDIVRCLKGDAGVEKGTIGVVQESSRAPFIRWLLLKEPRDNNIWAVPQNQIELVEEAK